MNEVEATTNPEDPLVGTTIQGKYKIVRLCGRGGMGSVYEAQNLAIGKHVALKFIDPLAASNADAVQRFLREAQAASAAESLHIVQVFDVGELAHGTPYIVMELLRGENLAQRLARLGRLPVSEAVHIAVHTLRGLRRAHEMGIVHRDLKPENIFLVETDDDPIFAKLVDFGVSKILRRGTELEPGTLTREGVVLGTPYYMAPEQAQGMPDLDARVDLWAVGAILYECLTGERPFPGKNYEQVIVAICTVDVQDVRVAAPSVPLRVAEVIRRALTRDRGQRVQTAAGFLEALREAAPELVSSNPSYDMALARTENPAPPTPVVAGREPEAGTGGRTRVSWSTTGGVPATKVSVSLPRSRWRLGLLGGATTVAAFGLTLLMMQRSHVQREAHQGMVASAPAASSAASGVLELRLVATPASAAVYVDDRLSPDGLLRGPPGATVQVRAQAEGYRTLERAVVLEPGVRQVSLELEAAAEAGAPSAEPRKHKPAGGVRKVPLPGQQPPGIGGLKLKTEGP